MSDYGSTPPPPPGGGTPPPPPGGGGSSSYGPPPPAAPYGGGGEGPVEHPKGMTILILGILSLIFCCAPLGIVAWVMGNGAIKEIDAAPGRYSNRQIVQIGRILGIIATVLLIVGILIWVVIFVLALMSGDMSGATTTY